MGKKRLLNLGREELKKIGAKKLSSRQQPRAASSKATKAFSKKVPQVCVDDTLICAKKLDKIMKREIVNH